MRSKLFAKATQELDTRYEAGVRGVYESVMEGLTGRPMKEAVKKFMATTLAWHEKHRHNFRPYPNYRKLIERFDREKS